MSYERLVGRVQYEVWLAALGEAMGAIREALQILGKRMAGGEAKDWGTQVRRENAFYLFFGSSGFQIPKTPQAAVVSLENRVY